MHYVTSKRNSLLALAVFSALSLTGSVYAADYRSEERRVGKEWRSWESPDNKEEK